MKRIGLLGVAFAAMLTVACGGDRDANRAQDNAAVGTAGEGANADRNALSGQERDWVEDRMIGNMAEAKLGELASQKGQHASVKAFGRQMTEDHTKANEALKQVVSRFNIQAPAEIDDEHRQEMERLSKLEGAEFDREYANKMVDAHENTLEALEDRLNKEGGDQNPSYTPKEADSEPARALNQWAAKTAPTVRQHLEKAQQMRDAVGRRMTNNDR